jgi:ADP-ribose pyrophosphatase YjhB (NUDIX family)
VLLAPLIRVSVSTVHQLRRAIWFITRPHTQGVHAVPLTSDGGIVLVRLTYRSGWHLPGGGRKKGESERDAVLRELREEIGLVSWSSCEVVHRFKQMADWRHDSVTVFTLRDVEFRPRRSLEIAEVRAFPSSKLPSSLSEQQKGRVQHALTHHARRSTEPPERC